MLLVSRAHRGQPAIPPAGPTLQAASAPPPAFHSFRLTTFCSVTAFLLPPSRSARKYANRAGSHRAVSRAGRGGLRPRFDGLTSQSLNTLPRIRSLPLPSCPGGLVRPLISDAATRAPGTQCVTPSRERNFPPTPQILRPPATPFPGDWFEFAVARRSAAIRLDRIRDPAERRTRESFHVL